MNSIYKITYNDHRIFRLLAKLMDCSKAHLR